MASCYIPPVLDGAAASAAVAQSLVAIQGGNNVGVASMMLPHQTRTKRQLRRHRAANAFTLIFASASLVTSALAIYLTEYWLVCLAFSIPLFFTAPLALVQRFRLRGMPPRKWLQSLIQKIRSDVGRIHYVNCQFSAEINKLEAQLSKLKDVEWHLEELMRKKGGDLRELRNLIRENGKIQKEMNRLNAAAELQQLMSVMLNSDKNQDSILTEKEFENLLARLKAFSAVDQNRLRIMFQAASSKSFGRLYNAAAHDLAVSHSQEGFDDEDAFDASDYLPWED